MSVRADPGLSAVARVRGVREQESLLLMQRALAEQREREERLDRLNAQLRAAASLETGLLGAGAPGALLTLRMSLGQLSDSLQEARSALTAAKQLAENARARWESAKSQLSAVEQLLERRAAERRAELDHQLAREADDLAGQSWLRQRDAPSSTGSTSL